ncbi:MAG: hypothetical protein GXP55_05490 [Deltaproteobacteria bacterium]|nr:hypothetical protein [Deltaproteobacteria bacterium]
MDFSLLHPQLVHLPLALAVLMPFFAAVVAWAWWRKKLPRAAWFLVLGMQVLLAGGAFAAKQAGEEAEERVEHVVAEQVIEEHAEAAEAFVVAAAVTTLPFLLAAFVRKESVALGLAAVSSLSSCVPLVLAILAGQSGGALVYEHGAANAYIDAAGSQAATRSADDDDDD